MRRIALLSILLLAGCVGGTMERYDPHLYDANGDVLPPAVAAAPPVQDCREVEREVMVDGAARRIFATACRQADGTWRYTN